MNIIIILLGLLIAEVSYLVYKAAPRVRSNLKGGLLIDTSALMDGRIVTAAQTGFLPTHVVVPRSVINELQLLADQADHEKRSRARRGLDAIKELQGIDYLRVEVVDDGTIGKGGVDERLIDLAKRSGGSICTIDFNLNKAASAMGVRVLNINELAGSIRMAFLPGETISMTLSQKGQSNTQAVGYLADGTMVVVDKAASKLGETVEIEFIRSLQTAAGRMMFAKLSHPDSSTRGDVKSSGRKVINSKTQEDKTEVQQERPAARKPSRRQSTTRQESIATDAPVQEVARTTPPRRSNRRKSVEDSLIELVNKQ